jgi:AAA domain
VALEIKNTRDLISPDKLKLKIILFGLHGSGKTTWMSGAPNLGAGICETGHGKGLMSVASKPFDYVEINSYADYDAFCSGTIFKDKDTLGLDSLSEVTRTVVKDKALSIPRTKGESQKRLAGVMELDDYGVVGELTRKLLKKFIDQPKHIIVTSGLKIDRPDDTSADTLVGPDLAGQLFLGSTAMFDLCLCLRSRQVLRDPKDAKTRYTQRYFVTDNNGSGILAKNRFSVDPGKSFLPLEIVFDPENNIGTFDYILKLTVQAYAKFFESQKGVV